MRAREMSMAVSKSLVLALVMLAVEACAALAQSDDTVEALNAKVSELHKSGRYAEAVSIARRAVALAELQSRPDHLSVAPLLEQLAVLYYRLGRYGDAEAIDRRALVIRERALGPDHPDVATTLNSLAVVLHSQGRHDDAEPLLQRALLIRERALGRDHQDVATTLNNLAVLYAVVGRYTEAEVCYRRSLTIRETVLGPEGAGVGESLNNLAMLYESQGRYADALTLLVRAFAIRQKAMGSVEPGTSFGPAHHEFVVTSNNLATILYAQGHYAEAEQIFRAIVSLLEIVLAADHADVGTALNNLAEVYRAQARYADADPFFRRALSIWETALGPDHPLVAVALDNLGSLYRAEGRYSAAETLYKRALAIREKVLGPDHPEVGQSLNNLAVVAFDQHDWIGAANFWRRSTALIVRRTQRGTFGSIARPGLTGKAKSEVDRSSYQFWSLIKALYRLEPSEGGADAMHLRETFQAAQWARASEAAQALGQMAARGGRGDPALAALVRERQDLVEEWQKRDGDQNASLAQAPDQRDRGAEAANATRLAAIDARIAAIDKRLTADFPEYAALAMPAPLPVEEVQAQLGADEALVLFLDTPELHPVSEETFIWVVTKAAVRRARTELGKEALAREVQALRCGLDAAAWGTESGPRCTDLLHIQAEQTPAGNLPLPFDPARAHALYAALFGEVEDLIRDKHLLIVPSGPLTLLPLQVLITVPSTSASYRSAAWLARKHALTVLPAVSSLKALRRTAKVSRAGSPYLGIGNPLLDGPDSRYASLAQQARDRQTCSNIVRPKLARSSSARGRVGEIINRSGVADLADLRVQTPLPETADELCAVARDLKVGPEHVRLGARAGESDLKGLSERGMLANYRILHFATHGALSGELKGGTEPGLILNPPRTASVRDDGYLSASEVAGLRLNADWVILSACNTAAGGADNAEALSGLSRAFFYAGARALLVSHWAVYSDATVKLITTALSTMAADTHIGRAEALRRSMLALIANGTPQETHPAYWAPFVVVGEGAALR
jgi:CHAT domain-containing protein/Flp pilus assembly protein TadD